jgi:RimJ/RimL family protein N-acetyltransferase
MRELGSVQTERLRLERWGHEAHGDGFAAMNAQPEVVRYLGGGPGMTRAESDEMSARIAAHWETYGFGLWAAVERATGDVIGFVGLCHPLWWPEMSDRVEVGWRLRREAWGAGYATEGARAALRAGFGTLGLDEIVSFVDPGNARSLAVTRRLGMRVEREIPHPARAGTTVTILSIAAATTSTAAAG